MNHETTLTDDERRALERLRQENDWRYREMAALASVTLPTLQRILRRKGNPNARTAFKLRRFLDLHTRRRRTA